MNKFEKAAKNIADSCGEITTGPAIMQTSEGWDNTNRLRTTPGKLMQEAVKVLKEVAQRAFFAGAHGLIINEFKQGKKVSPYLCIQEDFEAWASKEDE